MRTSSIIVTVAAVAGVALVGYAAVKLATRGSGLGTTGKGNTGSDNKAGGGAAAGEWGAQAALLLGALGNLGVGTYKRDVPADKTDDGWGKEGEDWIWVYGQ